MKRNLLFSFLSGHFSGIRQFWKLLAVLTVCLGICAFGAYRLNASCIALDDVPLDVQQQTAPGIVMFCIDNSGSMDWEVITAQGAYNGLYDTGSDLIGYTFKDPGDNIDPAGYYKTLEEHAPTRWQAQWAGFNRLYYDPTATYTPWPTYTDADLNSPRSNPTSSTYTLSLSGVFYDFGAPLIYEDSLRNAGAVFVDNLDTLEDQGIVIAPEIIMDTEDAVNDILWDSAPYGSCTLTVTPSTSKAWTATTSSSSAFPPVSYTNITISPQNDRYYYSPTTTSGTPNAKSATYTATWSFTNITPGSYDVYAWWVQSSSNTSGAHYKIDNVDVATKNQSTSGSGGKWQFLATKTLGSSATVSVSQTNGTSSLKRLCADAVKIVPKFNQTPDILFEKTGPLTTGDLGWQLNTTTNAYKRPQDPAPGTYYYTYANGQFSATWTAKLNSTTLYDVYAVWAQGGGNRSTAVHYYTTHSSGTTDTTVNQEQTLGYWTKIAGGTNGITFADGIGKVVLGPHTVTNYNGSGTTGDRACADAVAFVPHGTLNVQIHRAHYYVQDGANKYLVDIDGTLKYYSYVDDGDNLVESNEITRLDPAQVPEGILSTRTYTQERQNFANWYSFYRRREFTAKNAIGNVIDDMQGVYIGIQTINSDIKRSALPVRVTINNETRDDSATLLTALFGISSSGGTPLRVGLQNIGKYFQGDYGRPASLDYTLFTDASYPFFKFENGGTCQQAFTILMTDGYWNEDNSLVTVGNADKLDDGTQIDGFDGPPFADEASKTLADVAMHYYEHDLNPDLNNNVPIAAKDRADHQHLVTYTLSFGVSGTLDRSDFPNCPGTCPDCPDGTCPGAVTGCPVDVCQPWPAPAPDQPTTIDDLFHAAVNGRGKYVNASTPIEMVDAMNELKQDIENRLGSAAALATSSIQRQEGTMIYQGTYNTAGWFGEVKAIEIDVLTGAVGDPVWQASEHVPAWATRNILSYDGSGGIEFEFANISEAQETLLENNGHSASQLVDFIRGDASNNTSHGGPFRVRTKPLGDFIHSAPTFYKGVIYIGSNDGMLHAINAVTGEEKFCYVPNLVYDHLSELAVPGYSHKYYVDGTAVVSKVGTQDILVCGLGKGGKGYFGLDVTTPNAMTANKVLWEYPSTADNDLGYTFSNATIVTTHAGQVVVFGNGYDSVNQKAILYLLDPVDGTQIRKLDTLTAGCNGLSTPKVVDVEGDGYADYAFAGDLLGNMWRFDLRDEDSDNWAVYYQAGSVPKPLITVRNGSNAAQAITAAPEVMLDCVQSNFAKYGAGLMVIFGTGRYLNSSDFANPTTQSFYGIWDWGDIWEEKNGYDVAKTKYLGTTSNAARTLSNVSGKYLQSQTVTSSGDYIVSTNNTVVWYNPDSSTGYHMGWFFDLPTLSERAIREPMLRQGVAVLISLIPSASPCEAGGSSMMYMVSACTGGRPQKPQFDINGDGIIDNADMIDGAPPAGKKFEQILFEPIEIGDILYLSDSQGNVPWMQVRPTPLQPIYWRLLQ